MPHYLINPIGYNRRDVPVWIRPGVLRDLPRFLRRHFTSSRIALITDRRVARLHLRGFGDLLTRHGIRFAWFRVDAGERAKTRATKARLEDRLLAQCFGRDSLIVAIGGGVVGDLAGFVAATYLRGIPYIHVPTTLVAQTDSAIGGKTGVDTPAGKNLIGAFHPPRAICIDPTLLTTLPPTELRQGLVEMVKYGVIADAPLARTIARAAPILTNPRHPDFLRTLLPLLIRSLRVKIRHVSGDEHDTRGRRTLLNYGHTFGHAIEQASSYRIPHGDAVAMGMSMAARIACTMRLLPANDVVRQEAILHAIGAPTILPRRIPTTAVWKAMRHDKKCQQDQVRLVLLRRLGRAIVVP